MKPGNSVRVAQVVLVLRLQTLHHAHSGRGTAQDVAVGEKQLDLQEAIQVFLIVLDPFLDCGLHCSEECQCGSICMDVCWSLIGLEELEVMQRLDETCGIFCREIIDVFVVTHGDSWTRTLEPSLRPWPQQPLHGLKLAASLQLEAVGSDAQGSVRCEYVVTLSL